MGRVAHLRNVFEYAGAFLFNRRLVSAMPTPSGTAALGTATFLADGGEMGRRIREFDWSTTALGAAAQWPASLKTVVRLMLTTNHAVFVFWGPDLICLYNDAYSRSLGKEQHPSILGMKGPQAWAIAWDVIAPQIALVTSGRRAQRCGRHAGAHHRNHRACLRTKAIPFGRSTLAIAVRTGAGLRGDSRGVVTSVRVRQPPVSRADWRP